MAEHQVRHQAPVSLAVDYDDDEKFNDENKDHEGSGVAHDVDNNYGYGDQDYDDQDCKDSG